MREKTFFAPLFFLSLGLTLLIFAMSRFGLLGFIENGLQVTFFPLVQVVRTQAVHIASHTDELTVLKEENAKLHEALAKLQRVASDNTALRDQFQTVSPAPEKLLPVVVVGMPGLIPNVSFPDTFIINAGKSEGVGRGMAVVVKNELIGVVVSTSSHFATVRLVTSPQSSFSVTTSATNAIGVGRGMGNGEFLMSNVVLSDTIKSGDTVVTKGGENEAGIGIAPGLIVGKIATVEKNPSSLFQEATVVPLVAFDRLIAVFVVIQ